MTTSPMQAAAGSGPSSTRTTWRWALRRTLIGVAILSFVVGGAAWLLYAAIDPEQESAVFDDAPPASEVSLIKPAAAADATHAVGSTAR